MNKEEYDKLKQSGMIGILRHYMNKLHSKEITKEVYAKAIAFWSKELKNKDTTPSFLPPSGSESVVADTKETADQQESSEVPQSPQETIVDRLIKDFGSKGITIKDTGVDITNEKKNNKK